MKQETDVLALMPRDTNTCQKADSREERGVTRRRHARVVLSTCAPSPPPGPYWGVADLGLDHAF